MKTVLTMIIVSSALMGYLNLNKPVSQEPDLSSFEMPEPMTVVLGSKCRIGVLDHWGPYRTVTREKVQKLKANRSALLDKGHELGIDEDPTLGFKHPILMLQLDNNHIDLFEAEKANKHVNAGFLKQMGECAAGNVDR